MRKNRQWFALLLGLALTAGCTLRQADLTAISTRNVSLAGVDLDSLPRKKVEGKDSAFIFLFIPFGQPHLEDAIDQALDAGDGDLLLDGVVYTKAFWLLFGSQSIEVKGTAVNTRAGRARS